MPHRHRQEPRSASAEDGWAIGEAPRQDSTPTAPVPIVVGDLAYRVASRGPAACESDLDRFVVFARLRGASPVLLSVLGNTQESDVARQRAFGRIVSELDNLRSRTRQRHSHEPDAA